MPRKILNQKDRNERDIKAFVTLFPEPVTEIDEQTIHFWNLQLQFLSTRRNALSGIAFYYIELNPNYRKNKFTKKMKDIYKRPSWDISEEEHECLATHLALQLSGIEE